MCVINREQATCELVEISVPFDAFLNECYMSKFNKYMPLCQRICDLGYRCKVVVLVVGSLGCVHKRYVSGLKQIGLQTRHAKATARYSSISATIGSQIIWKQRCRTINQQ